MHFLLFYEFVPDYLTRRTAHREKHLQLAWDSQLRGELILAGPFADPVDGAVLMFKCDSRSVPEHFAATDPYVTGGLVTRWSVREWTTVVGNDATKPVKLPL
ncbi:MAG: YciI-like protein [Steroidobacteraceae bacterium]